MAAMYVGDGGETEPRFTFAYVVFNSYHDDVRAEVERQSRAFAEDLGSDGIYMEPFEGARSSFAATVRSWQWPTGVVERFDGEGEPIILVVYGRLTTVDPENDRWAIIWLSDFEGAPYNVKPLFQTLARKTKSDHDVIEYLHEVAVRRRRRGALASAAKVFAFAGKYVDWKPSIPFVGVGVGVDVKAVLMDIAEAAAGT